MGEKTKGSDYTTIVIWEITKNYKGNGIGENVAWDREEIKIYHYPVTINKVLYLLVWVGYEVLEFF